MKNVVMDNIFLSCIVFSRLSMFSPYHTKSHKISLQFGQIESDWLLIVSHRST